LRYVGSVPSQGVKIFCGDISLHWHAVQEVTVLYVFSGGGGLS